MKVERGRNYRRRGLVRRRALLIGAAVLLVAALAALVFFVSRAISSATKPDAAPVDPASAVSQAESASEPAPSSAESGAESSTQSGTESQSSAPAESGTESGTDSAAESVIPVEPGDYSDAAFIGDSRTEALKTYGLLKGADYYTYKGLKVDTVFTEPCIDVDGSKMTVMDAIGRKQYKRIYIMLGVNELGWVSTDIFIDDYGKIIDKLKETQPGATIYVQSILPVSAKKSEIDEIYNNPRINEFNGLIQAMAEEKGAIYLPVNTAVMDETGALPAGASTDGVHPNIDYCRKWTAYLDENT